jgi:hypothetical protein
MKIFLILSIVIFISCKNQKNDKIIVLKNPSKIQENEKIKIDKNYSDSLFLIDLEKIKLSNRNLVISNDFYYIKSDNGFFRNKKNIISLFFLNDNEAEIQILGKDKTEDWKIEFKNKIKVEKDNYDFNLINYINFDGKSLVLIPEYLSRNYYNYVIIFDHKNIYNLSERQLANPEFSSDFNKIYSFHYGGVSKLTCTEYTIENNDLIENKFIDLTLPYDGITPKDSYSFKVKNLITNKNIEFYEKYKSNENLFNETNRIIKLINYH